MLVDPDPKTGLAQRDAFFGHLHREVARCNDHGGKIALLIVDIDEFAQINAGHGYAVGAEVLRHVAQDLVPHGVPVAGVDLCKLVNVNDQQGDLHAVVVADGHLALHLPEDGDA